MFRWWSRRVSAAGGAAVGRRGWPGLLALGLLACVLWAGAGAALARSEAPPLDAHGMPQVALVELPREAHAVMRLIRQGGPFPYEKDGTVFFNRERLLPAQKRGYYREYTVPTPGLRHRGARRIVCGGWERAEPDACYYTADHYASFRRIAP